jgi:hypothetical protein
MVQNGSKSKEKEKKKKKMLLLMEGMYEVSRSDGLRCHDTHTKFYKDWLRHLIFFLRGYTHAHRREGDLISLILFFKIRKVD